jgi:hypothetical protein
LQQKNTPKKLQIKQRRGKKGTFFFPLMAMVMAVCKTKKEKNNMKNNGKFEALENFKKKTKEKMERGRRR